MWAVLIVLGVCLGGPLLAERQNPWGHLTITPIVITPPVEYVPQEVGPISPTVWHFPGTTPAELSQFFRNSGVPAATTDRLVAVAKPEGPIHGLVLEPPDDIVRSLLPDVRSKVYYRLAKSLLNFDQNSAYYFRAGSIDTWLGGPDVTSPELRKIVEPLIYRIGDFFYLADIEQVRAQAGSGPAFQALVRRLLRQQTMFVSLSIAPTDDLDKLEEYWGRGGRRTDIEPILESVAASDESVKISELLPDLPRRLLYRFPKVRLADTEKSDLANCFWTALNFFNDEPDDRFLDPRFVADTLKKDYFLVHGGQQLGDVVVFSTSDNTLFHVAVYLADDLLFTKNGAFSLAPWVIMPMDQLKGRYVGQYDDWKVTYYRRKDL
jgi:hypothetical protein